jgi:hypothetical protein
MKDDFPFLVLCAVCAFALLLLIGPSCTMRIIIDSKPATVEPK